MFKFTRDKHGDFKGPPGLDKGKSSHNSRPHSHSPRRSHSPPLIHSYHSDLPMIVAPRLSVDYAVATPRMSREYVEMAPRHAGGFPSRWAGEYTTVAPTREYVEYAPGPFNTPMRQPASQLHVPAPAPPLQIPAATLPIAIPAPTAPAAIPAPQVYAIPVAMPAVPPHAPEPPPAVRSRHASRERPATATSPTQRSHHSHSPNLTVEVPHRGHHRTSSHGSHASHSHSSTRSRSADRSTSHSGSSHRSRSDAQTPPSTRSSTTSGSKKSPRLLEAARHPTLSFRRPHDRREQVEIITEDGRRLRRHCYS